MPILMNADYVKGVTIWGWIYGSTWSQAPDSGLVKNGKSRPAMTYLMDLLGRTAP
jgi:GH35 family endo-1,4-beta-xylanase